MDINKVLNEYDAMYGSVSLDKIEDFLFDKIKEAMNEEDTASLTTLLNEMIGLCRDTTQKDKALIYCGELQKLLERLNLQETQSYATSMLNIANAYRAFGLHNDALNAFARVESCYKRCLDGDDALFASLYNNWGLLYQEIGDYAKAKETLLLALAIVDKKEGAEMKKASTLANLGAAMILLPDKEDKDEAVRYIREALALFEADGGRDFHYGAALAAMGDAYYGEKDYINAAAYYQRALLEVYKHTGRNDNYDRVYEKYQNAVKAAGEKDIWISNLERSRKFYDEYGKNMIHTQFGEYEKRIAVGVAGEGSDCFGFDDAVSMDHDYAPGFCMWLTDEDYAKIGERLQRAYNELVKQSGIGNMNGDFLERRRGVSSISGFYNRLLAQDIQFEKAFTIDYAKVQEYQLAQAVNGEVFRDDLGVFTGIREQIGAYYPEKIWRVRLAQSMHDFSQYAQSNYPRMMARKDYVTASMCIGKTMESIMDIMYLLNKRYAPYYKWKKKGLEKLEKLKEVIPLLERLAILPCQTKAWENGIYTSDTVNTNDEAVVLFEKAAEYILKEMTRQGIAEGSDTFLELYISRILEGEKREGSERINMNTDTVEKIVELEWKQFDKVINEGGRAECQDDFATFSIMRKSQYMTWNDELLASYLKDLQAAETEGRNLITEKYARMMESTAPDKYEELKEMLPVLDEDRIKIQEEIIKIQITWMEDFAKQFPVMAGRARSLHTFEDKEYDTSYETYLRGELGTYSDDTFVLYGRFIAAYAKEGKNLAYDIMDNTAKLYGYASVEAAEAQNA